MTDQDQKRKLSNLRSMLTRRAKRKVTPAAYECVGGPFSGSEIYLETSSTGTVRVGAWTGRYITASTYPRDRSLRGNIASIVWEEAA